jgi:hypothetical protein
MGDTALWIAGTSSAASSGRLCEGNRPPRPINRKLVGREL